MASTHHHFDWKKLEEKPDNWETLRHLIGLCNSIDDVYNETIEIGSGWTAHYLDLFQIRMRQRYGAEVEELFLIPEEATASASAASGGRGSNKPKKHPKKGANTVRDRIHRETENRLIEKDLDLIRFDTKTFRPLLVAFRCQPTFAFMIAEWNIMLYKRIVRLGLTVADRGVLVDAMISLDRIEREDIACSDKIDPAIRAFFSRLLVFSQRLLPRDEVFHQLFQHHPELMLSPFSEKRSGRMRLYAEQIQVVNHVVDAVMRDSPLLLGDRMPPGTGKTFLAIPLAQKLAALKCGKTVLFACNNHLVRTDVATTALLGKNIHLWMGRYDRATEEFLIRPHKSCFPINWKQVYKTQDDNKTGTVHQQVVFYKRATGHFPDILVADLETCRALLAEPSLNSQFVGYIDEFVSDPEANAIMIGIAQNLPRQSVLLSAILPRFEDMPALLQHFISRHRGDINAHVVRIESNQLTISCTLVDPLGRVALPHHFIDIAGDISMLIQRIREDPLIGRMYAPQQVFELVRHLGDDLPPRFRFEERFPTVSRIDHAAIREYVLDLLDHISTKPALFQKMRDHRPYYMAESPDIEQIATRQSHYYRGKTLVLTSRDRLFPLLELIRKELHHNAPDIEEIMADNRKRQKEIEKRILSLESVSSKSGHDGAFDAKEHHRDLQQLRDELAACDTFEWPRALIVNTPEHAARFHHPFFKPALVPIYPKEYETAFSTFLFSLLLSGIGVYEFAQETEYQRRLVMRVHRMFSLLFAGHEIVFGTNIEALTNLFIDGCYGDHVSRNVLYQLIGRAGRVGQSYEALIVLNSETTLQKIMSFSDPVDEDARFFQNHFATLLPPPPPV